MKICKKCNKTYRQKEYNKCPICGETLEKLVVTETEEDYGFCKVKKNKIYTKKEYFSFSGAYALWDKINRIENFLDKFIAFSKKYVEKGKIRVKQAVSSQCFKIDFDLSIEIYGTCAKTLELYCVPQEVIETLYFMNEPSIKVDITNVSQKYKDVKKIEEDFNKFSNSFKLLLEV